MLAKEDYISAIGIFRQIPSQAPEAAAAANGLAIAYDALGRNDLAQRYFEQAMGLDSANESYRRNYARFTDKTRSPTLVEGAARPAGNAIAALVKDRSTLARMSLSDVRLQTLSPAKATAALAPPAEIHLSLAGSAPKLDAAPDVSPQRASPTSRPIFSATAVDLAQAVRAARLRISPAGNGVVQAPRCSSDSGASSCAS
jgi:tetratricopeptide (TPR) repeat protein